MHAVDIDLDQLPIPDWDLRCPTCDYTLNGLPTHRCPECGTEFNLREIIPTAARLREPRFTGWELPIPDLGLDCRKCSCPLAGARERRCDRCFEPFDPQALVPNDDWFMVEPWMRQGVPLAIVGAILDAEYVPYVVGEHYNAFGGAWSSISVARDFIFDLLYFMRLRASETASDKSGVSAEHDAGTSWSCENCSQENPANFAVCWSCQTARSE